MAEPISLVARPRTITGKAVSRLRRDGQTPIVVYGHMTTPVALQVDSKELAGTLGAAGTSRLVILKVDGEKQPRMTLVRDVQRHVTRLNVIHADFMEVAMNEAVRSEIPVELLGEPKLVGRHEALLEHSLTHIMVEAMPADLPSSITLDIGGLEHLGQSITVSDIATGGKFVILHEPDTVIARLLGISRGAEAMEGEAVEEETAAEPEVISQRRAEEAGD
jgi:large subunit ribosomal protein L25